MKGENKQRGNYDMLSLTYEYNTNKINKGNYTGTLTIYEVTNYVLYKTVMIISRNSSYLL